MSDERDDASESPEDAADDADQSNAPRDSHGGASGEGGGGVDGPDRDTDTGASDEKQGAEAGEPGDGQDDDTGASGEKQEAEAGEPGEDQDGDEADQGARPEGGAGGGGDNGDGQGRGENGGHGGADPERVRALAEELGTTREQLADLEARVDENTVHRDDVMAELKRYVRARQRRGHATGWGPYLVLLYGTAMSLGAFYYLGGWPVIAALVVIWLSTLGLFVVMLLAGALVGAGRKLGSARDIVGMLRR